MQKNLQALKGGKTLFLYTVPAFQCINVEVFNKIKISYFSWIFELTNMHFSTAEKNMACMYIWNFDPTAYNISLVCTLSIEIEASS